MDSVENIVEQLRTMNIKPEQKLQIFNLFMNSLVTILAYTENELESREISIDCDYFVEDDQLHEGIDMIIDKLLEFTEQHQKF